MFYHRNDSYAKVYQYHVICAMTNLFTFSVLIHLKTFYVLQIEYCQMMINEYGIGKYMKEYNNHSALSYNWRT